MGHSNLKSWDKTMSQGNKLVKAFMMVVAVTVGVFSTVSAVSATTVNSIDYNVLSAKEVQVILTLSEPLTDTSSFTINNPARLAVDLPGTSLNIENRNIAVESGFVRSLRAVEAGGRTRLVVNLVKNVPYDIRSENNQIYISLTDNTADAVTGVGVDTLSKIEDLDFRRGTDGSAVVKVKMSDENASVSVNEKGDKVVVEFFNFELPDELSKRLDVTDFATPASFVDFYSTSSGARLAITATGHYDHLAYQAGNDYTIELKPISKEEAEEAKKDELGYSGEKLSLNFQNIEVRAVLQLIADFTGLNIVASDSVGGNITLRLKNVPWDQALDIILKTRGLGMRKSG
ncbi:MAG: AMIN domain-containing protein, partial [Pseudomonadota bacterium]